MKSILAHTVLGYPNFETSRRQLQIWYAQGIKRWELQIPFSHPTADGESISVANAVSLKNGYSNSDYIHFLEEVNRDFPEAEIYLMTYAQKAFHLRNSTLNSRLQSLKVSGWIIPDLPLDSALGQEIMKGLNARFVPVIGLNTSIPRVAELLKPNPPFLYFMSGFQTTGKGFQKTQRLEERVRKIREITSIPIGIGFGIRTVKDVYSVLEFADMAIIGSAFIQAIQENRMEEFAASF